MRLATLLLTGALALPAQNPPLPWKAAPAVPWQMGRPEPPPPPFRAEPGPKGALLAVELSPDGAVRITDSKGLIRLRLGLPGRPLLAWRDWGIPLLDLTKTLFFPAQTPLKQGIGGLPVGAEDFRPALEGLLWILDDDESILTVIHPATTQVVYLPLPEGRDLGLVFRPDRLDLVEGATQAPEHQAVWSVSWLVLLPQFVRLGRDNSLSRPRGTALVPFPKE